jgi:hypothetical protein
MSDTKTSWREPHGFCHERGLFLPTVPTTIEPLTPLSRPVRTSRLSHLRGSCILAVPSAFGLGTRVGGYEPSAEIIRQRLA